MIASHAAIGMEQWLGRLEALPWRVLMPHGYLHVMVCIVLGFFVFCKTPEGRFYHLSTTASLLWSGFGVAGTLFFSVVFASLEAYAVAGYPLPVPSWVQQDWQTPIKQVAMRRLQKLERYLCEVQLGMFMP